MKEITKKNYCTPVVEVLLARIEKGFAGSLPQPPVEEQEVVEDGFSVNGAGWNSGNTNTWFT